MKKVILISFLFINTLIYGQTIISNSATVYLKNKKVLNGEMRMGLKGLRIKHNSKKFKVYMGKEIDSVHISTENEVYKFEYIPLKHSKGNFKDYKLMQPVFVGKKITLYNYSEAVYMSNGFGMYGKTGGSFSFLYAIRNNEKIPTRIGSNFGFHKGFRKEGPKYFKDCPDLVSKINNDIFTKENIIDAFKFYETTCAK
ncbi:hypothetical protein L3X37_08015 [Sabulilitoribacter arenilitoris]|uniref:Uncharacterized protein n=1 Tax=Wocania arenilitoris TaxID=2044858 RepID=A0AAE3EPQ2_9FLAO|nr:hypothetical protein [Wocania arenilitoris]MCF7568307.1 hypothetical protein [Wocania arenilitoris]